MLLINTLLVNVSKSAANVRFVDTLRRVTIVVWICWDKSIYETLSEAGDLDQKEQAK